MQFNSVIIEGRIVKQSGTKEFSEHRAVCNFTIVHDYNKEDKMFFNCSYFANPKRVEFLSSLKLGNSITINGRLDQDTDNGNQKLKLNI